MAQFSEAVSLTVAGNERTSVSDTDNNSAKDLASLKLTELRAMAAQKGLRGISGLRKGDLIAAITTGQVPGKAPAAAAEDKPKARATKRATKAAPKAEQDNADSASANTEGAQSAQKSADNSEDTAKAPARRTRRVVRSNSTARSEQPESNDASDQDAQASGNGDSAQSKDGSEDHRYETRSQARRARRNRARHNDHGDNQDDSREGNEDSSSQDGDNSDNNDRNDRSDRNDRNNRGGRNNDRNNDRGGRNNNRNNDRNDNRDNRDDSDNDGDDNRGGRNNNRNNDRNNDRSGRNNNRHNDRNDNRDNRNNDDDDNGRRGRRGRRNRRNRGGNDGQGGHNNNDMQIREGDELQAVGGILEVVDNNVAFLRTSGYRAMGHDVFVNNNLVRRLGLRSGDAVTGQVKVGGATHSHGNGRNRRKYNQLVRVDTVNGLEPEQAKNRPEFNKLTPLYPNQRLRLETTPNVLTTRVIDLIMPIGKGQRALIVSPPKAGKTTILQNIANAIATNNPECYLMVVLVDERPEEVTDMQRSVKGEVIASTFDRPPSEHTAVAELAIERAKRLVEQGKDVVVLLDSITRLGRAYNNSSPASGRILSGGVDSNALYPPKRFLGAARNIEDGGSLTIIATAMVETGSTGDTVIFEEFKGTGNAELKLDRSISERRVFPAVDVNPSGTRKDELLLVPEEAKIMTKLRRILSGMDSHQAIDLLIKQLKKTKSNGELLMGIATSAPMVASMDEEEYS